MKRSLIDLDMPNLSISRQCELIGLARSTLYYEHAEETPENLLYMRKIDKLYTKSPFFGSRKMTAILRGQGYCVNRKRIQRLMEIMGLEAIYQKPNTSLGAKEHKIFPYLLNDFEITRPNQVWSADITYIPMGMGFMYLVAIIDWFSRYVLSWRISNTMDVDFCMDALESALKLGQPDIFNTDQGSQFTCYMFTDKILKSGIRVSMDGRGRFFDNIFIERLWRTVKYEDIYLKDYKIGRELFDGMSRYFPFYNTERPHQSLQYKTPASVHKGGLQ